MPSRRTLVATILVLLVLAMLMAAQPYLLPPTIALGPCGRDWTSPSSYLPRSSPTLSTELSLAGTDGKLCYGSPSARGRDVFGSLVPWGELWRTGANEPTRLFLNAPLTLAGIELAAGRYSLYTIPGESRWQLFVSTSTYHWGNAISAEVRERELGSAELVTETGTEVVENLTFRWQPINARTGALVLEWADTRVAIPVARP
ncbi:MAG: DUF2911 domain-containing protein [Acidobacteriota bacterium]|nr:DUF2911 domain-containing protein [Acidobacteriota bacterium]